MEVQKSKWNLTQVIEGAYVSKIVFNLFEMGVFEELQRKNTVKEIAEGRAYDVDNIRSSIQSTLLQELLDFVSLTTDILENDVVEGECKWF